MNTKAGNLAVRALNHWRPLYMPTYLALRLLIDQVPKSPPSDYVERFLTRKAATRELCSYREFKRFKSVDSSGKMEYRSFYAAGPSAALGEARVLEFLRGVKGLANRPCVFSYRWPRNQKAGASYRYFYSGYSARQHKVSSLLQKHPDYVVLVHDVQRFYPSISRDTVYERMEKHLSELGSVTSSELTREICRQLLEKTAHGVPIGPALGHVLANIALERVDDAMFQKLKERYLRYVDDILMVVAPDEVENVQSQLTNLMKAEGLLLHEEEGKRDRVTAQDWLYNMTTTSEQLLGRRFTDLIQRSRLFLWGKRNKLESLQKKFREAGIPMPVMRLGLDAQYGGFQRLVKGYLRSPSTRAALRTLVLRDSERALFSAVSQLRPLMVEAAKRVDVPNARQYSMVRRMRVQRLRFLLNRLLYVTPINEYQGLLEIAPEVDEFFEYRKLVEALLRRRLDAVLPLPGPAVATIGPLLSELGIDGNLEYDERLLESKEVLDSVCSLLPYGVMAVPESWIQGLNPAEAELVRFSRFSTPLARTMNDHSFEDEIRSLQLGATPEEMRQIANSRFSDSESINLEALLFGEYGS